MDSIKLWQMVFSSFFCAQIGHSSVILSGGLYCSTDGGSVQHAVPGTVISITCAVDNPSPGANLLEWTIPSYGVSVSSVNGADGADADQPGFISTVNSFNNTEDTTNATLTLTAVSELDGAVVNCADVSETTSSCTLYVLSPPSSPLELKCTDITNDSLSLVWSTPDDDGGESISNYRITRIPGEIMLTTMETKLTENNLNANTTYEFIVSANNSQGFGMSINQSCTTTGRVLSPIENVQVCLGVWNKTHNNIIINMTNEDCPPSSPDLMTTPPFDNFTITVSGFDPVYTKSCVYNQSVSAESKEHMITITVNNQVGPSEPTIEVFDSQWVYSIDLYTNLLTYSIVNCTTVEDAITVLNITESSAVRNQAEVKNVFNATQPYHPDHTTFDIDSFERFPTKSYRYTLIVTATGTVIASTASELTLGGQSLLSSSFISTTSLPTTATTTSDLANPSNSEIKGYVVVISVVITLAAIISTITIVIVLITSYIVLIKRSELNEKIQNKTSIQNCENAYEMSINSEIHSAATCL